MGRRGDGANGSGKDNDGATIYNYLPGPSLKIFQAR